MIETGKRKRHPKNKKMWEQRYKNGLEKNEKRPRKKVISGKEMEGKGRETRRGANKTLIKAEKK